MERTPIQQGMLEALKRLYANPVDEETLSMLRLQWAERQHNELVTKEEWIAIEQLIQAFAVVQFHKSVIENK